MYFEKVETFEELKKEYLKWVKILYPDCGGGGDEDEFKKMIREYELKLNERRKKILGRKTK